MISEISPFKDFVCIKVCHNRRVRCFGIVFVCPCSYTNRTSKELQTLLSLFFFSKFELPNRGCGLSTGAAYTRNFTVVFSWFLASFPYLFPLEKFTDVSYSQFHCCVQIKIFENMITVYEPSTVTHTVYMTRNQSRKFAHKMNLQINTNFVKCKQ